MSCSALASCSACQSRSAVAAAAARRREEAAPAHYGPKYNLATSTNVPYFPASSDGPGTDLRVVRASRLAEAVAHSVPRAVRRHAATVFGVRPQHARAASRPRRRFRVPQGKYVGTKWQYKLSVVSLEPASLGDEVRATLLPASQGKGITSVKFSPSLRYVLLGYGVRGERTPGAVPAAGPGGIDFSDVACSLYRTLDMRLTSVVRTPQDDVNIAVFNPLAGHGFAYGTKQGRLRVWGTRGRNAEGGKLKPVF